MDIIELEVVGLQNRIKVLEQKVRELEAIDIFYKEQFRRIIKEVGCVKVAIGQERVNGIPTCGDNTPS